MKKFSLLGAVGACFISSFVSAVILDFNAQPAGGNFGLLVEDGFKVTGYNNPAEPGIGAGTHNLSSGGSSYCSPDCPNNGSNYLLAQHAQFIISEYSGNLFSLTQFDGAEAHEGLTDLWAVSIRVIGTLSSGDTVIADFTLDWLQDGDDVGVDFQTFLLPTTFVNLSSVTFLVTALPDHRYFSIDNIDVSVVPVTDSDTDGDDIYDSEDNCLVAPNLNQLDTDSDGIGDACDPPDGSVYLGGTIKTGDGSGICAMVLASGQFMFSCSPDGGYSLPKLPSERDGTVKRQIYADGFFPRINILPSSANEAVVLARSGTCPKYNTPYDPGFVPGSAGRRINISGKVLLQDSQTPICAMALANGQYMFTCDGTGNYALNIPLDSNGQFKLQIYADGFAPTIQSFNEFRVVNDVRMARATECQ